MIMKKKIYFQPTSTIIRLETIEDLCGLAGKGSGGPDMYQAGQAPTRQIGTLRSIGSLTSVGSIRSIGTVK